MHRFALVLCACCMVLAIEPAHGQAPTLPRSTTPRQAATDSTLPVRRVVLYKNGVGYFEHLGKVRNNEAISIDFNSAQLDDVLKSLTALDLGSGRVSGISYNSEAPLARRLAGLRLPVGERTTLPELLMALRGARLEVRAGPREFTGRLLGIERRAVGSGATASTRDELSLVSDSGEIRTVELTPAVTVRLAERDSAEQVGSYLGMLALTRAPDRRRMTISTTGTGERDLLVSYVSEVPIWKTNYRVVLTPDGERALLQGWAIVDNTTGEDWTNIELSLVAGAPQSFIEQLSQPRYGRRPVVQPSQAVSVTPQTHDPTLMVGVGSVRGTVRDTSSAALPGVTVRVLDGQRRPVAQTMSDQDGGYTITGLPAGSYRLEFVLAGFQMTAIDVTVVANAEVAQAAVMRVGSVSESVTVSAATQAARSNASSEVGIRGGIAGGVTGGIVGALQAAAPPPLDRAAILDKLQDTQAVASAQQLTDLFEYRLTSPISIPRNQSALVPIVHTYATVERVSLFNGRTGARPLRALWLTNTTGLTLDGGSFTVLDDGAFAGEGLIEPLKPEEKRLLSYAVELGLQIESRQGDERQLISRVIIQRGAVIEQREQRSRRVYTIRNNDTVDRTVIIEHQRRVGWTLAAGLEPAETSATTYRFQVNAPAKQTTMFTVDETQPVQHRYEVSSLTDDSFNVLIRDSHDSLAIKAALQPILAKKATVAALSAQLANRQTQIQQISGDEQRVRENLRALKDTAEEKRLAKRYAAQLTESEDRIDALRREQTELQRGLQQAQTELGQLFERLALDVTIDE